MRNVSRSTDHFHENRDGALFVENWKAAISQRYKPDYVFVDSRTGLTDVGGVCTLQLPDLLVLMFSLNQQNIRGTEAIIKLLKEAQTLHPPQILPVATPVPNLPIDSDSPLQRRLQKAKDQLGLQIGHTIGYNAEAALVEKLYTAEDQSVQSKPVFDYAQLLTALQGFDKSGLDSLLSRAKEACKTQDIGLATALQSALLHDYSDRADALFQIGLLSATFGKFGKPTESWHKALELDPDHQDAYEALRSNYERQGKFKELVDLVTFVATHTRNLTSLRRRALYATLGQVQMARGDYRTASDAYSTVQTLTAAAGSAPTLQHAFNWAEAKRRSEGVVDGEILNRLISLFEAQSAYLATQSWDTQANVFQAMHIPYALVGRTSDAVELLNKAKGSGERVSETQSIFLLKTYRFGPPRQFLADNTDMLASLYKGTLWDGCKIPKPAAQAEPQKSSPVPTSSL